MELGKKLIRKRSHLHDNFSIEEVLNYLEEYPKGYRNFVEKDLKCEKNVDKKLLLLLEGQLSTDAGAEGIEKEIKEVQEDIYPGFWEENENNIRCLLIPEMEVEEIRAYFYLIVFLHIQAERSLREQDIAYIQSRIEQRKKAIAQKRQENSVIVLKNQTSLKLPNGQGETGEFFSLTQIENAGYMPVRVWIEGTDSIRSLFHGEILYAVKKGEGYIGFLPRLTERERECGRIYMLKGKLEEFDKELRSEEYSVEDGVVYYRTMDSAKVKKRKENSNVICK